MYNMTVDLMRKERGQELKKIRKSKGVTQEDLAKISGVSLPTIIRMESGKENYGIDRELSVRMVLAGLPDKVIKKGK